MNLIDAIKSGRPFRRQKRSGDWFKDVPTWQARCRAADDFHGFDWAEEILAVDWEIQEKTVTITQRQFWDAYASAVKEVTEPKMYIGSKPVFPLSIFRPQHADIVEHMVRELGLGDEQ